jgi:hypothetical protein
LLVAGTTFPLTFELLEVPGGKVGIVPLSHRTF